MVFEESFFAAEEREGFFIDGLMKHCWAAQLEVLERFSEIAKKHGIRWYAAYGTLLGAVRHKGFIPWDDDIDICVLPEEFARLVHINADEFQKYGLELVTPYTEKSLDNLVYRLVNGRRAVHDPRFLKEFHGFPYPAGLDIFVYHYVPRDAQQRNDMMQLSTCVNVLVQIWDDPKVSMDDKRETYRQTLEVLGLQPAAFGDEKNHLMKITEGIFSMCRPQEADHVADIPEMSRHPEQIMKKEWFENTEYMPFENLEIPVPAGYEKILCAQFGKDYMIPKQVPGEHVYPYYAVYREQEN